MKTLGFIAALALVASACSKSDSASTADTVAAVPSETIEAAAPADSAGPAIARGDAWVDPNTADAAQLTSAGVSADLAAALVAARPYADMRAVDKVLAKSLSEKERDSVYTRVWMPIDLNKATGDEIMLIPGVGARMRHEFEEYRPYTSIEQFRKEIGKYVDKAEVMRLERYVKI